MDYLSAEGAKNVFWLWLTPFLGWSSLTMSLTGKFVYIYINIYIYIYIYIYTHTHITEWCYIGPKYKSG